MTVRAAKSMVNRSLEKPLALRNGIRDHSPVVTRSWMIDQRPSPIGVTSVLLARFFGIAQPLRSRRSGGR